MVFFFLRLITRRSQVRILSPLLLDSSKASHLRLAFFLPKMPNIRPRLAGGVFRRADLRGQIRCGRAVKPDFRL